VTGITHIVTGELTLAVRKAGEPAKPCFVLLHGWPQTSFAWNGVLEDLGTDNYVLAFDLPGVGDSLGAPPSSEKTVIARIILDAAEAAGGKSIIVVGYDVGGMIAFACARDHGARVDGAVVMNTVIPGLDPWAKILADPRIFHFALHNIPNLPEVLVTGRERPYFDLFYDMMAADPAHIIDEARAAYVRGYSQPQALKAGFDWYRAMAQDAEHNAQPKRIDIPLLYLRGDADGRTPAEYANGLINAGVHHLETGVLPHSGEYAPEEAPQALIAALRRFRRICDAANG
jgi:pimeloyl-ACP methyl ester carboxylesterase